MESYPANDGAEEEWPDDDEQEMEYWPDESEADLGN
jgi:hypothetical protein